MSAAALAAPRPHPDPTHLVRLGLGIDCGRAAGSKQHPLDGVEFTITIRPGTLQAMSAQASYEITRLATEATGGAFMEVWYWPDGDVALGELDGTTGCVLDNRGETVSRFIVTAIPADNVLEGLRLPAPDPAAVALTDAHLARLHDGTEPDLVGDLAAHNGSEATA